jgi:hypothetical protein
MTPGKRNVNAAHRFHALTGILAASASCRCQGGGEANETPRRELAQEAAQAVEVIAWRGMRDARARAIALSVKA